MLHRVLFCKLSEQSFLFSEQIFMCIALCLFVNFSGRAVLYLMVIHFKRAVLLSSKIPKLTRVRVELINNLIYNMMKNALIVVFLLGFSVVGWAQSATYSSSVATTSCWKDNPVIATATQQNSIAVYDKYVYVVYYNADRYLCISRSSNYGKDSWKTIQLSHRYEKRNDVYDSHNTPNIIISPNDKRIHLAFDMHAHDMRYMISWANTATISDASFTASRFSSVRNYLESSKTVIHDVTYPRFFVGKSNKLFMMYRDGGSGDGDTYLVKYKDDAYWETPKKIIEGKKGAINGYGTNDNYCAYFNEVQFNSGKIYLTWVWRETPDETTDHDLMFAYSGNDGVSWKNSAGSYVSLPMHMGTSGLKVATIAQNTGLSNHNGCAIDGSGNVHTMLRRNGAYEHHFGVLGADGKYTWKSQTAVTLSGDRPKLYCDKTTNTLYLMLRQNSTLRLYATVSNGNRWNKWAEIKSFTDKFTSTTNSVMSSSGKLLTTMAVSSDKRLQVIRWTLNSAESATLKSASLLGEQTVDDLVVNCSLFPNPSNGHFTLELNGTISAKVSIFNTSGQMVYYKESTDSKIMVNESLKSGIYMVQVLDDQNKIHRTKLVVK